MLTRLRWLWLCMLMCACSGLRCGPEQPREAAILPKPKPDLRLFLLTDPKGYLEPCGCQQRPLGGVPRLATALTEARADGAPTLLFAAGDLAWGMEVAKADEGSAATQEQWRAETLLDIWKQLGMAAALPGPLDLRVPETSKALAARGGFPWLLENESAIAQATLPLSHATVLDAGGVKVGVLGLIANDPGLPESVQAMLSTEPLGERAEKTAKELREKGAQLVVALFNGDRRAARELAGKVDVVLLGGLDSEQPVPPVVQRGTVIVHAGRQGQRVVTLDLGLGGPQGAGEFRDESAWTRDEAKASLARDERELAAKIEAWEKAGNVEARDLETQKARLASLRAELRVQAQPKYEGRWFDASVLELSPDVPEEPQIAKQLDAYDVRVNDFNRTALKDRLPVPAKAGEASYVGSEACASCHTAAFTWWKRTPHGNAYATLEKVHKEFNLSCVGCHVTGYNKPGGSTVTHVEKLQDVGCENCHGPGSLHIAEPSKKNILRDLKNVPCQGCHTPEHSEHFVYDAFRALLIAPGHGLPPPP